MPILFFFAARTVTVDGVTVSTVTVVTVTVVDVAFRTMTVSTVTVRTVTVSYDTVRYVTVLALYLRFGTRCSGISSSSLCWEELFIWLSIMGAK